MTNDLSLDVQMQFMRPDQVEAAVRKFPVVYVPFGVIEWHGRHLPLGTDALKAHAFLVKCAEQFGGVVYPPVYFHAAFDQQHLRPVVTGQQPSRGFDQPHLRFVLTELFQQLKNAGFRVIIGVSGHNIQEQLDMINAALASVVADGTVRGIGLWEISLTRSAESNSDHAAKWETSDMMFFYPQIVDLSKLGNGPLQPDCKPPDGIGGLDPRTHASAEVGKRNVELAVAALGNKAKELLASLPEHQRSFALLAFSPEHWWMI